ncbi:hypothetical protein L21SP3_01681 [Sedimentisphaera cyanobacteriorum]|uniref:SGNH hydrolase-type esterase domain-containing protein n=1 Tax=Sedimentisphaera cyanobacteriorum TaxID=1940790 RepID=A0A1Q2HR17_9BACT|nr:SGNH/GDSL hydrolase family protein [Sedimentisphaera cyanobacteriorum]AQQ09862.1 hypothetical protein L21SP3_01681 [Sedimentisphaera cyanobacteriorum]
MRNTKLLKKALLLVVATGLIGLIICAVYIHKDTSLDSLSEIPARATSSGLSGQLKIGVIGDSWVARQKLDYAIESTVAESGFETVVLSSGHPGAKSRQIYRNLFLESGNKNSSNALFMDDDLDYLVVVAGVNDSAGHIGKAFYSHHMLLIVQAALARGIKPVIVEVPEYGIEDTPSVGLLSWVKRSIYLWLFDGGKVDVIREYRKALQEELQASGIDDKVFLVRFSSIANDYNASKDLYANSSHLNHDGYSKLGKLIADSITEWHNKAMHSDGNSAALHFRR